MATDNLILSHSSVGNVMYDSTICLLLQQDDGFMKYYILDLKNYVGFIWGYLGVRLNAMNFVFYLTLKFMHCPQVMSGWGVGFQLLILFSCTKSCRLFLWSVLFYLSILSSPFLLIFQNQGELIYYF